MKRISAWAAGLFLLTVTLPASRPHGPSTVVKENTAVTGGGAGSFPSRCTVFTVSMGRQVFFGGNDDYVNPDSYYWVDPGDARRYGAIWIGRPDNVQQGVNEKGLAYDANGLPRVDVNPHDEREPVPGDYTSYPIHILHECASVEEVIGWVRTHRWHSFMHDQMHFADATGDAVIISAGADGEVALTLKPPGDGLLVSTNFNVANPANGLSYPCWRYDRATEMLGALVERGGPLSADDVAGVLEAVHVAGGTGWTIGSILADLPHGLVYLYYFHQFDRPVRLDVKEELALPRSPGPLSGLFPDDVRQEAARRYRAIQRRSAICRLAGMAWASLVLVSLILLVALSPGDGRRPRFWVPAVILLGPLAVAIWFATRRGRSLAGRRSVLLEVLGDLMPSVVSFLVILIVLILVPESQSARAVQIGLVFGLPLLIGLLVFHGPLLAPLTEKGYGRWLSDRLPQALLTVNLGLGGAAVAAMPLVNLSLRACSLFPLRVWTLMIWWGIVALGALGGGLVIYLYEGWAVRRGFRAWSVLPWEDVKVSTPTWRGLGWRIAFSYAILLAGIAAGTILSQALTS